MQQVVKAVDEQDQQGSKSTYSDPISDAPTSAHLK